MISDKPLVSIGMPVYNGAQYLCKALDSLLAQDYINFELIISDNGSTDGTQEICLDYVRYDKRIQYHRNSDNKGAGWNFKKVLDLASGEYFMWAAYDDLWDTNYISECVYRLQVNPEVVLCCASLNFIDKDGNKINKEHPNLDTTSMNLRHRVKALLNQCGWFAIYGLMRTSILRQANMYNTWGGDVIMQLELLLHGNFLCTRETQFHYRLINKTAEEYDKSIDPSRQGNYLVTPYTQMMINMLKVIRESKLNFPAKILVCQELLLLSLFGKSCLSDNIRKENYRQFFEAYQLQRTDVVRRVMMLAFLLNPRLIFNLSAWRIVAKAVTTF